MIKTPLIPVSIYSIIVYFCAKILLFFYSAMILSFFYLQMSQKSRTFADVIQLERHIEILLLSNDCVIVPDLGGFMAHHLEAQYDEEDGLFLPPQRTLGFNPQLKLNDSLLVQSYVEAYDISYPEAIRRIETEVAELKQYLETEGCYELNDIGQLTVNDEGKLEFEPCEAGILTPELYGLPSFEIRPLTSSKEKTTGKKVLEPKHQPAILPTVIGEKDSSTTNETTEEEPPVERAITIKMSWIRNTVAVAAALLAFLMMSTPVSNSEQTGLTMSQINLPIMSRGGSGNIIPDQDFHLNENGSENEESEYAPVEEESVDVTESEDIEEESIPEAIEEESIPEETQVTPVPEIKRETGYGIVVASQVSRQGAEDFVKRLQKEGYSNARVYLTHNIRRVICDVYPTKAEAYRQLQKVHQNEALAEAWVYKMD